MSFGRRAREQPGWKSELIVSLQYGFTKLKGQKFTIVHEFRPRLSSLTPGQLLYVKGKKGREREERVGRDERNDSRRQRRGEGLTFGNKSKTTPTGAMYRER
ncbi:hypothetical protein KUCAC02_007662 [Chaenocephalus aceratus]|uniref:Uncharacterized protein n=1 Tax=Chaenocephalus aceratus TaxID=36190 RepID=A0ACB9X7T7_CHAAC|nr:hypothetical protein KUCAC02_007662 [Chaenocephalus aceratus]